MEETYYTEVYLELSRTSTKCLNQLNVMETAKLFSQKGFIADVRLGSKYVSDIFRTFGIKS